MVQYIISEVQGYNVHESMGNVSHQFREGGHHSQFSKTLSSQSMLCGVENSVAFYVSVCLLYVMCVQCVHVCLWYMSTVFMEYYVQ